MPSHSWDAKVYSQFLNARTRPARDLLAAIPEAFQPKTVYDLGCGPGNSTILLQNRWPKAAIIGLDSSQEMLDEAKTHYPDIQFIKADIAEFSLDQKVDCIFSNATLHWLKDHESLIPRLFNLVNLGGVFAIQIPNNFHTATHQTSIKLLQQKNDWQPLINHLCYGELLEPKFKLNYYYDLLGKAGAKSIQLWETEYLQEMSSHKDIFDWVKGTGLRPALSAMDADSQATFAHAYIEEIAKAFPVQQNGKVLLPFRRVFVVGLK